MKRKKIILPILIFTLFLLGASSLIGIGQASAAEKTVVGKNISLDEAPAILLTLMLSLTAALNRCSTSLIFSY